MYRVSRHSHGLVLHFQMMDGCALITRAFLSIAYLDGKVYAKCLEKRCCEVIDQRWRTPTVVFLLVV